MDAQRSQIIFKGALYMSLNNCRSPSIYPQRCAYLHTLECMDVHMPQVDSKGAYVLKFECMDVKLTQEYTKCLKGAYVHTSEIYITRCE